jgi:hypothetical protein
MSIGDRVRVTDNPAMAGRIAWVSDDGRYIVLICLGTDDAIGFRLPVTAVEAC